MDTGILEYMNVRRGLLQNDSTSRVCRLIHKAVSLLLCIITLFICPSQLALAKTGRAFDSAGTLARAQSEYKKANFDKAIILYRKYLRKRPKDYNTWNNLAASYFHAGLPTRAARYLKLVEKKTTQKSYNAYYSGLSY